MNYRYGLKTKFGGSQPFPKELYDISVKERLLERTKNENGCLIWQGCLHRLGYGQTSYRSKPQLAHRVSWMVFKGEIPKGLCVCHKCDNPKCINPDHLFLGTQQQNIKDCYNKGRRSVKGENHPYHKLKNEDILEIFALRKSGLTQQKIAEKFKVNQGHIGHILKRKAWSHLQLT